MHVLCPHRIFTFGPYYDNRQIAQFAFFLAYITDRYTVTVGLMNLWTKIFMNPSETLCNFGILKWLVEERNVSEKV